MKKNANSQNKLKLKHSSAAGCFWLLLHFLIYQPSVMSLPPGPASSCKRALHKRARSQTLKDIGRLCCARQPTATSNPPPKPGLVWLLAPSPWFWWMPDELKRACRVQSTHCSIAPASVPSPCLPWHFLNLMEEKNEPITNQVKCQTAYLSVLMSNNDQVAANQPMSAVPVSCWEGGRMSAVCCLLTREPHKLKAVKGSQSHKHRTIDLWIAPIMKIQTISSEQPQRSAKPADYRKGVNERGMILRCSVMSEIIHLTGLSVHAKQILQLLPDDGFQVTRMWVCWAADIFRSAIWGESALHSQALFTKGTSYNFFFFFSFTVK